MAELEILARTQNSWDVFGVSSDKFIQPFSGVKTVTFWKFAGLC